MNANLLEHLAQALSQKFNINLNDVKKAAGGSSQGAPQTRTASPKKRGPTKDDLLKEAKALGLKVTTKMRKGEIQALLDAEKIPVATYHPSQVVATPEEPKPKRTPKATPEGNRRQNLKGLPRHLLRGRGKGRSRFKGHRHQHLKGRPPM
jgi:hypothetical protein